MRRVKDAYEWLVIGIVVLAALAGLGYGARAAYRQHWFGFGQTTDPTAVDLCHQTNAPRDTLFADITALHKAGPGAMGDAAQQIEGPEQQLSAIYDQAAGENEDAIANAVGGMRAAVQQLIGALNTGDQQMAAGALREVGAGEKDLAHTCSGFTSTDPND
jgi:hypothetical protein